MVSDKVSLEIVASRRWLRAVVSCVVSEVKIWACERMMNCASLSVQTMLVIC